MKYEGNCERCGKPYVHYRTKDDPIPRFCSRECSSAARNRTSEKTCEHCGKQFTVQQFHADRARFCSRECYWASGAPAENVPNVQKERRGESTYTSHKAVYVGRDENGKPQYIQRSHQVWNLHHPDDPVLPGQEVHHIDRIRQNDSPENLQKVSKGEHRRIHGLDRRRTPSVCPVCGKEFHTRYLYRQTTCSNHCSAVLRERKRKELRT